MIVKIIYPADKIGDPEKTFLYLPKTTALQDVLDEARATFEDVKPRGLPASLGIRPMAIGDMIQIDDKFFIVAVQICRHVSDATATNWRKRTLVERMLGSGHHDKICSGTHAGIR